MTFGAAGQNAQWGLIASLDQKGVNEIVGRSIAAGVNFFDTADVYSVGQSEQLLGQSLKDLGVQRSDVRYRTKVARRHGQRPDERARFLARATSWIRSRAAWSGCSSTISIFTSCMVPTP